MSDLISRSAVLDIIREEMGFRCGYDASIALLSIKKSVSELPKAFDVEKVLGEIKAQFGCRDCEYADVSPTPYVCLGECAELEVINDICDIVKRGGVE